MSTTDSGQAPRVHFSAAEMRQAAEEVLQRIGYAPDEAAIIGDHLLDAALCGYEYSGLPKILELVGNRNFKRPRIPMSIAHETPVSVRFDGGNNVAMLTVSRATDALIARASQHGFAVVGVFNTWMSGRSAYYLERVARAGLIGMQGLSSGRFVAPPGAARPVLGTNPVAFSFPTESDPLVIDLGTAAFMGSERGLVERRGGLLPEGVAIDSDGRPTRDPRAAREGALLTFAGYRGFAISLAMQALGVFGGSGGSPDKSYGYLLIAMRPDLLMPLEAFRKDLSTMIDLVKSTPRQEGVNEIRIPSERAFRERARRRVEGAEIDERIWKLLQALPG
jgi:LDH2 family malate/lactate/ureidoglycolate dehydrogenase